MTSKLLTPNRHFSKKTPNFANPNNQYPTVLKDFEVLFLFFETLLIKIYQAIQIFYKISKFAKYQEKFQRHIKHTFANSLYSRLSTDHWTSVFCVLSLYTWCNRLFRSRNRCNRHSITVRNRRWSKWSSHYIVLLNKSKFFLI